MDNFEFENINNNVSEKQADGSSEPENTVYGAVYTPDPEGNGYSCQRYNENGMEPIMVTKENKAPKRKRNSASMVIIAVSVLLCVLLSGAAAFGATLLAKEFAGYPSVTEEITEVSDRAPRPSTNNVYFDNSPDYTEQTVTQGSLLTMEEAIRCVKDSVVEITTESVRSGFGGFSQYVVSGAGSGVIISDGGYIITNNHVIDGASNIIVRLTDGSEHKATLIGTDSKTDVAVISIIPPEGVKLTSAVIGNSDNLDLGQTVIAIGNPLGELGGTVTDGIISCLAREIAIDGSGTMTLLQTNAAVSPGNSGGGLFDLYGRLIGVVNAKFSGDGVEGISFAIPANTAWDIAKQLIDKGYVSGRPDLGVSLSQVQYGYNIFGSSYYQIVVTDPRSVKELEVDDIIVSVDNQQISTIGDLADVVSSHKIGDVLTLTVVRGRRYLDVNVTLVEYEPPHSEKDGNNKQ